MRTGIRGIAVAAVLVTALAGCGGGDGTDPVTGSDAISGIAEGEQKVPPVSLDEAGMINALPHSSDLTSGTFGAGDPDLVQGAEVGKVCLDRLEVECPGARTLSMKDLALVNSSSDKGVTFILVSFGTEEEAAAVLKTLEKSKKEFDGPSGRYTPVKVESGGADESFAIERNDFVGVYMRIGTVLSYVITNDFGRDGAESVAQVQVGRLKVVAGGGDPDA
ncbi:hypothetical protein [Streptomyces narbonensis]|uniref:hypothetical protein n=1 Tax=Streptomyces narbonensis TaxID=67333 RepID=UPI00167B84E7|nr:hypothetical protein [Streptomyces narbonensis]GGV94894.1 hypothetical protein GCM10010230_09190 [Streptomyces narbonensis]